MKAFPRWLQFILSIVVIVGVLVIASKFSQKSPVIAEGDISIAAELSDKAADKRVLFLVVFDQDSPMPMPYGALRVELAQPPQGSFHHFILTHENLSVMAGKLSGELKRLRIKARLSNAMTIGPDSEGDLVGEVGDIPIGSTDVQITIDKGI